MCVRIYLMSEFTRLYPTKIDGKGKKEGKDQESTQSSTTPSPSYHIGKRQSTRKPNTQSCEEVSLFPAGDLKGTRSIQDSITKTHVKHRLQEGFTRAATNHRWLYLTKQINAQGPVVLETKNYHAGMAASKHNNLCNGSQQENNQIKRTSLGKTKKTIQLKDNQSSRKLLVLPS